MLIHNVYHLWGRQYGKWAEFIDDKHAETQLSTEKCWLFQIKSYLFVSVACIAITQGIK